jgi:AcrR family transcriptional regulator
MKYDQSSTTSKRPYHMRTRAASAAATGQRIIQAAMELYMERWLEDLTLDEVAVRAGVTVQTVLRRFGSKAGVIQAVGETVRQQVIGQRGQAPAGDIAGAVANLMEHYETVGDLSIRTLAQEERHEVLRPFTAYGRAFHHAWVETAFGPLLDQRAAPGTEERADLLTKLVVVADVYVWKLLRRDMGLGREHTKRMIEDLVRAVLGRERRDQSEANDEQ